MLSENLKSQVAWDMLFHPGFALGLDTNRVHDLALVASGDKELAAEIASHYESERLRSNLKP